MSLMVLVAKKYNFQLRLVCGTFKNIFKIICYHFFYELLIVVSLTPPNLGFGILRKRIWFKHFRLLVLHDFNVGILTRVCNTKRLSSPYSNLCLGLYWKSRSYYWIHKLKIVLLYVVRNKYKAQFWSTYMLSTFIFWQK